MPEGVAEDEPQPWDGAELESELKPSGRRQRVDKRYAIPGAEFRFDMNEVASPAAEAAGASPLQSKKAHASYLAGLCSKAERQAACRVLGARGKCSSSQCARPFYVRFSCRNRYCPMRMWGIGVL